jgi:hypothetical protein
MLHSMFKYMNSGLKLFVSALAVSSMARGAQYVENQGIINVNGITMDGKPVTIPPGHDFWFNTYVDRNETSCYVPAIDCAIETDYSGKSGTRLFVDFPYQMNPSKIIPSEIHKESPVKFSCLPKDCKGSFFREALTVNNQGCGDIADGKVCEDARVHNGPNLIVICNQPH